ncbi:MAG: hypothetical protein DWQ51_05710 [Microcystis wesenbergii TW10]|uniref:Ricin B lectin domain-containing protein n=1 Tax=Microcystis wesenbergii TW10 TaxID=2060474 RepID=A0A3E0M6I7_9CHRO|nr:MAG: hypothetical protein DWQ51_05710 [Microcystis wesenbergii TW10]
MRFSKALRFRSISILFISIFVALQVHFFPALRPANSEPVTLGTIAAVVALVKAVSASGLARGVCFSGLHMGANECRKPSRCVEGIERLEKIVNTNGSSESVRQLENWIGSASQNERCAISLSRHITGGVNIVDLTRQAVAELDRSQTTPGSSGIALRNQWSGKCLQTMGQAKDNGSPVNIWDCSNTSNQFWTLTNRGELRNKWSGKCLQTMGQAKDNGSPVNIWDCSNTSNQFWTLTNRGELRNNWSGKCLQTMGQAKDNGSPVNIWDCSNTSNQFWR